LLRLARQKLGGALHCALISLMISHDNTINDPHLADHAVVYGSKIHVRSELIQEFKILKLEHLGSLAHGPRRIQTLAFAFFNSLVFPTINI
jgi:hypothetical protein